MHIGRKESKVTFNNFMKIQEREGCCPSAVLAAYD